MTRIVGDDGDLTVEELGDGRRRLTVCPADPAAFVTYPACITSYPTGLVERMFAVRGNAVCDDILRDEDPGYVELGVRYGLFAYLPMEAFRGGRLLDFGCGSAASTVVLARLLPETEVIGIDLDEGLIDLARLRAQHYGLRVRFEVSPGPESLPDLGTFDFVVMHAVYEHLLPAERPLLLRKLWAVLRPGGVLFLHATPNRWFPLERHTTRIWGLNYLPDGLACRVAHRFSRQFGRTAPWEQLLRIGIRGATRAEILRNLGGGTLLRPALLGCRDEIDIWYAQTSRNPRWFKPLARMAFKVFATATRHTPTPSLTIAIGKQ